MSLLRSPLKNIVFYFTKEAISTSAIRSQNESAERPAEVVVDPKDRSKIISLETSIRYLNSKAYQETYGNEPVWTHYRRNFKGQFPPQTRKTCIRHNKISTGSPCPICRDEYLVVDYKNINLLKQFIVPEGGNILGAKITGVCQKQHRKIVIAIKKAWDYGLLTFEVPHRYYNYNLYYKSPRNLIHKHKFKDHD